MAESAARRIGDALKADGVLAVDQQRQVGDRVFHLSAVVKLRPTDHLISDLAPHERVFKDARLRVHTVEDGNLGSGKSFVDQSLDLAGNVAGLGVLVIERSQHDRIALAKVGPERLWHLIAVVGNNCVGRVENRLC